MTTELRPGITLVLGGQRSGKSVFAENLILGSPYKPVYLATGRAEDEEMSERIAIHRQRRKEQWELVEEPKAMLDAINNSAYPGRAILVDCLTMWITNLMLAGADPIRECEALVRALPEYEIPIVFVTNEVGLGIVPDNEMARQFGDLAGKANQMVAAAADHVYFIAAGLPMVLKSSGSLSADHGEGGEKGERKTRIIRAGTE